MAVRSGAGLRWSLLAISIAWQLPGRPAHADGAFPDSQNIITPAAIPNEILLATNFGLVMSVDAGQTWTWTCEQTQNNFATLYQLGPPPMNRLFAMSLAGLIYTDDLSCSWSVATGIATGSTVSDLFPDPSNPARVLAVVAVPADGGTVDYQVLQSANGGATFAAQPLYTAAAGDNISGVEISRSMPATVYLTLTSGPTHLPKLAQSTNSGSTWQLHDLSGHLPAGTNFIRLIAVDPTNPQKVFLRIRSLGDGGTTEGVAVTTDGGATASVTLSFPGGILSAFTLMSSGTIMLGGVVGTTNVAYTSADGGGTFQPVTTPQPSFRGLSSRGGTLFVVADNQADGYAVGTSTDLGKTWTPLMAYEDIQAIQTCLMSFCQTDCLTRAGAGQWSPDMCSATPSPLPVDAGADAHAGGTGGAAGGTTGHAGTGGDASVPPGGKSGGGCHCAAAGAAAPGPWALGGLGIALALGLRRRRRGR
jgi:MYXO-CTERM domain-containing protein